MLKHSIRRAVAGATALVLGAGLAVGTAAAANAIDTSSPCIVDVIHHEAVTELSHQEYQYEKEIPGEEETFFTEWRFRTRTVTYGTVEHKYIYSTWYFVDGGTTTINGHVVSGHWVNSGPLAWHAIADSVINAVWGSGGVPDNLVGGDEDNPKGNVPLTSYGAPGGSGSPAYYATEVSEPTGFTAWGPWSAWGTTDPSPASDTKQIESRQTSNNDGTPASTVYYLTGGTSSTTLTDANWTTETPGGAWVKIDERKVIDRAAKDAYDENVYGDCPTDPCTSQSSTWFTEVENVLPTFEPNGLKFAGPNVKAVRYLHLVSGNLMGVIGSSYTIAEASGYHAALNYIINPHTAISYATIVIEPYQNGWAPGQTGTFTVTASTKVWTSKIPSGLGSQSNPATIAQMSAIFPDNELLAQGIHLGSNSVAGQYTVVSGITGCGDVKFVAPPTVSCLANGDEFGENLVLPETTGVLWKVNGGSAQTGPVTVPLTLANVTIQAVPASGYLFGPGTTSWTFEADENGVCQLPTFASFPTNVTHTDQVCASGKVAPGTITVGMVGGASFFTGEVDYFLDGSLTPMTAQTVAVAPGVHTVTAAPHDPDDTLDGLTSWEITVAAAPAVCGELTTLAITGAASPAPWMLLGQLLVVAGLAAMAVQSVRRRDGLI